MISLLRLEGFDSDSETRGNPACMDNPDGVTTLTQSIRVASMYKLAATTTVLLLLIAPSAAQARPSLSLDRADRAADREARAMVRDWARDYDPVYDPTSAQYNPEWAADSDDNGKPYVSYYIASYDLDPCERISATWAECAVTYNMNDGDMCDEIIDVRTTRRNRLLLMSGGLTCDRDDPADE
jgi:hypothetical protein